VHGAMSRDISFATTKRANQDPSLSYVRDTQQTAVAHSNWFHGLDTSICLLTNVSPVPRSDSARTGLDKAESHVAFRESSKRTGAMAMRAVAQRSR
jgi:hypothetical protein